MSRALSRVEPFERLAQDFVAAHETGEAGALQRLGDHFGRSLTRAELRDQIERRLTKRPDDPAATAGFGPIDAQSLVARLYGFESWAQLVESVAQPPNDPRSASLGLSSTPPFYKIDWKTLTIEPRAPLSMTDWDTIFAVMKEDRITGLNVGRPMTDEVLERLGDLDHVTRLNLGGSRRITDRGLLHLARMPQLEELDLSGWDSAITDRGLEVLRHLPALRTFQLCWPRRISDDGVANLRFCEQLESVDLLGTPTGDGAIEALTGKRKLRRFKTGSLVTDAGLPLLQRFPVFKTWSGGDVHYALMSADAEPNHLLLDGPFTDSALAGLAGLDGLFALSLFWHTSALTANGLEALADLPHLGFLGCGGALCNDQAMRHISAMPRLGFLMCQDTVAGDEGFAALGRSQSLEYIWGRRCHQLTGRGFSALAAMPALRGLSVSCRNVDDAGLSALPRFPALKEFMPMDVPDSGFRHIGRCRQLEALECMYVKEMTDAATGHIAGLSRLTSYRAWTSSITDRSLEILRGVSSLERLLFHDIAGITDAGLAALAGLPRLRDVELESLPNVTRAGASVFPAHVRVEYSV